MHKRKVILCMIAFLLVAGWIVAPRIAVWSMQLATKQGEESSQRARDRIVLFGERAIQPTIASIEKHSPWVLRYAYLPSALEKIDGTAQSQLLVAIDEQKNPKRRAYLISALQTAFDNYSRFDTVLNDFEVGRISEWGLHHIAADIHKRFPYAPDLLIDDQKLNPEFKAYWKTHNAQETASNPA